MRMLEVKNLEVNYGAIKAVQGIDFYIDEGEIVTLIGANGAGKTTTMNTIIGVVKAAGGEILFQGNDISKLSSSAIVKNGIALSPEGRQIFPKMTVYENLEMGAYSINKKYIKGKNKLPAHFQAVSSRCLPLQGRLCPSRNCLCWTSLHSVLHR